MQTNRRQFLKFFGLTISAVATGQIKAVVLKNNYYCNRKLGLSLIIPDKWQILSFQQYSNVMDEAQLDCYDNNLEIECKKNIGTPLIAMQAPTASMNHIYPTIHIWAQPNTRPHDDPVTIHSESYEAYGEMFKDYIFVKRPTMSRFAGISASHCRVRFISETKSEVAEPVLLDSYLFPRGGIGYTINFADHETNGWNSKIKMMFADFINSIEFAPRRKAVDNLST